MGEIGEYPELEGSSNLTPGPAQGHPKKKSVKYPKKDGGNSWIGRCRGILNKISESFTEQQDQFSRSWKGLHAMEGRKGRKEFVHLSHGSNFTLGLSE